MLGILARSGMKFLLTACGIFLVGSIPYLLFNMKGQVAVTALIHKGALSNAEYLPDNIHFHLGIYFTHIWKMLKALPDAAHWTYLNEIADPIPLFPSFFHGYLESMMILFAAMLIGLAAGIFITYVIMLIPSGVRRPLKFIVFVFEALPDIFVVVAFQGLILWFYAQTGILLMSTYSLFGDAFMLPILCLSFLPTFYIVKYLVIIFEEEEGRLYVELAQGKGLKRSSILWVHILRNALITLYNHFKTIFWFGLSNLLALSVLFRIDDGFITFLRRFGPTNPKIVILALLMVFIPFFIFLTIGEMVIYRVGDPERGES